MRMIPTMQCRPGMRLGRAIYTEKGNVLVGYRYELSTSVIERLYRMGIHYLYIDDPHTSDIHIDDTIREETRMMLHASLLEVKKTVSDGEYIPGRSIGRACSRAIALLIEDLHDNRTEAVSLLDTTVTEENAWVDQWVRNSIQCVVFAAKLGMLAGYEGDDLLALSYGALLRDIGCLLLPSAIMMKNGALTQDEFEIMKTHTTTGFKLLKDEPSIPLLSAHCALFHHERLNQTGYPLGRKGVEVHPLARWVGIIDAYVAMTSPRRYRKAMLPHEAMEVLYAGADILFDLDKVEMFRDKVVTFPPGISVALSTGEVGVVSRINQHNKQRPIVRVLKDNWGDELVSPYEIDLSTSLNVMIDRVGEDTVATTA
jgi:HD-GYP domain-containing protein (c-di-GMP phosphodiesterase class II)